ncbi:Nelf-A [Drosophila busckii]|uniref:Nelf-A n=1 Tax=Drosophila busckii TaxID=30019 RepID=A0A0M4EKU6_DROBS|nr:Nelf-A [Drosophila busckii]
MANVRDSDTSLWLHNKLGTSNDSWINGSICSQLNKEVLRNIKECFPDLQTQVKLKLLLSFLHIPRRMVEEWKAELEEVIEVAGLDTELWVSMLAETMKTFPATSSLNTEISDYEDTRPIFTDMVNDLRKLVTKHSDLGMLPLECQYLNKNALMSVVGQQPAPVKHFTLKRKPKSAQLRTELLHKSADAQSSLKKTSAPTIPLRSRGMPRKMTDTTPLKGIPSRMPTTGFRSPTVPGSAQRPNLSRTPAGRKDGGIKILDITEQPLGYAAAKKRKREQQLEEQQKKQEQKQQAAAAAAAAAAVNNSSSGESPTPDSGVAACDGETPTTPTSGNNSFEIKLEPNLNQSTGSADEPMDESFKTPELATKTLPTNTPETPEYAATTLQFANTTATTPTRSTVKAEGKVKTPKSAGKINNNNNNNNNNNTYHQTPKRIKQEIEIKSEEIIVPANIKLEKIEPSTQTTPTRGTQPQATTPTSTGQQRIIIQQQPAQRLLIRSTPQKRAAATAAAAAAAAAGTTTTVGNTTIKMEKLDIKPMLRPTTSASASSTTTTTILTPQQLRQAASPLANLPNNISVKITSAKAKAAAAAAATSGSGTNNTGATTSQQQQPQQHPILINNSTPVILASTPSAQRAPRVAAQTTTLYQSTAAAGSSQTPTKILLKTTGAPGGVVMTSLRQPGTTVVGSNPPPLVATTAAVGAGQHTLNIQNVQLPNRPVTIQPASQAAQQQHMQAQLQQQHPQHTIVANTTATQQPKLSQVIMQPGGNISGSALNVSPTSGKNKTIILTQKGVILRNIGGDMYQQIPISNVGGLSGIGTGATLMTTTAAGPPGLVKTTSSTSAQPHTIQLQQHQQQGTQGGKQMMPTLIPTNPIAGQHVIVQQQTPNSVIGNSSQQTIIRPVMTSLPQGLTLIQRPGQQPQLVQVQATPNNTQRTIITQSPQQGRQQPQQQILLQHKPALQQRLVTSTNTAASQLQQSGNASISRTVQLQVTQQQSNQQQQQQQQTATTTTQQQAQQTQQAPQRRGLSLSNEHVHKAHEMFRKANRVSRPDKALILGFMAGLRENPRPNTDNVLVIKLGESEEKVQQEDGNTALCLVESHIRLDYNTGEWKTFQNYRLMDQSAAS